MGYPSDLSDAEWTMVEEHFRQKPGPGRPPKVDRRAVLNAIFYMNRTGCQWRYLPSEFPPWKTVYWYFTCWRADGTWERLNDALRKRLRVAAGRDEEPSAAIIDTQSVKTTEKGGPKKATTGTRRSRVESAISSSIRSDCCWPSGSTRPRSRIAAPPGPSCSKPALSLPA